jgi:hypothetical protein
VILKSEQTLMCLMSSLVEVDGILSAPPADESHSTGLDDGDDDLSAEE